MSALTLLLVAALGAEPNLDPSAIRHDVKVKGAKAVVAEWTKDESRWDALLDKVQTGDPAWLALALALRPGTDAGSGESLVYALAMAMARNPVGVLGVVGRGFTLEDVCHCPLIEASPHDEAAYTKSTAEALKKVKGRKAKQAQACLKIVEAPAPAMK